MYARLLLLFVFCLISNAPSSLAQERKDYFVFLTTGKSTQGVPKEEIQAKQAAHINNFERQAKLGNLTAAGPCSDPNKIIRGIVVVHANSIPEAEKLFDQDPYVTEGFMKAEMHHYQVIAGQIKLDLESNALDQYVIAVMKPGKKWTGDRELSTSIGGQLKSHVQNKLADKNLGVAAMFSDQSNNKSGRVAVMIFKTRDVDSIKQALSSMPLVTNEILDFEAFPQFLAKNAF